MGGYILRSLIEANKFNITAITRQESTATLPSGVHVKKGDYASPEFLQSALAGQDVLIITLAATVKTEIQSDLIIAAAKSEVPWVIPNEYGSDGKNAALCEATPIIGGKVKYRKQIEELGKSSWIGIANSLWFDWVREPYSSTLSAVVPGPVTDYNCHSSRVWEAATSASTSPSVRPSC